MEAAFEGSDDEADEGVNDVSRPLIQPHQHQDSQSHPLQTSSNDPFHTPSLHSSTRSLPGGYNFEYDYANMPPPGSPPRPSALALPNSYGNTNGLLPTDPPARPTISRPGLFRRALGAVLPTHYAHDTHGGGLGNDGVFGNGELGVSADDPHWSPEDARKDAPPSYQTAQADAVPPYWENTILAPSGPMDGDMIIDGLPVGSVFSFMWNLLVSVSFQFVGFLLTFLLHTTHAAKFGSRAGLGITFIQYGFYMRSSDAVVPVAGDDPITASWGGPGSETTSSSVRSILPRLLSIASTIPPPGANITSVVHDLSEPNGGEISFTPNDWFSFMMMTLGWFILITSFLGFWRVRRWEWNVQRSTMVEREATPEDLVQHSQVLRTLEHAFGMGAYSLSPYQPHEHQRDVEATVPRTSLPEPISDGSDDVNSAAEDSNQGRHVRFLFGR
ncbi:uncharacterized protein EI90DRAFT_3034643 [Cantharellus anzutake]|uniref:uncharacterized protein n=1 Tax=Cantharellus anzutake TaxID=1750568 RepID=UPI00190835DA|nr:uncharacterized protein EI90DRAFT_3034643 [Cantharellus anzutake]KAF8341622.1 hypothetical protein EI90DRAFT_3034643 [Cantharellus anzutake]